MNENYNCPQVITPKFKIEYVKFISFEFKKSLILEFKESRQHMVLKKLHFATTVTTNGNKTNECLQCCQLNFNNISCSTPTVGQHCAGLRLPSCSYSSPIPPSIVLNFFILFFFLPYIHFSLFQEVWPHLSSQILS